jgi:hypothetical protein
MPQTNDDDKVFAEELRELIGLSPEDVAIRLELLDANEILNLTDAVAKKDRGRAKRIVGSATDTATKKIADAMNGKPASATDNEPENESDLGVTYSIGDKVTVGDKEGTVRIPSGPRDTIGVMIDGKMKMVDRDKVRRLDEESLESAAFGYLTPDRMRSLAGLPVDYSSVPADCSHTTYIEVQSVLDPAEAAQVAMSAIDSLMEVLPSVRLSDLKEIRARLNTALTKMNEGAAPRKPRF